MPGKLADDKAPEKRKRGPGRPFVKGQVANPSGRPKGTRNKLSESFIAALYDDFETHGVRAIEMMRIEKPGDYVKAIAALVPTQFQAVDKDGEAADMSVTVNFVRKNG
ncbi:hypothetical protein KGY14_05255 [Ameyamaea chiangmaiensis]|uniref:DUF5681 domain-containing protein n=1 Tax=Ameyamaea chiangmaiensis TaxID=442969 RepID=A0A850PBN4_9PROT|nr:hypothetical protein [Ameyamaea chiangmaiensis]MBS4074596.1 hypothetical protein [Ameyamaea chiangmaiensis]NVN39352.1 hypothetical protein [Ameyamaea chiangmaiensis]